jgi:hypothetical protein
MHSILPELLTKLQEGPRLKEEEEMLDGLEGKDPS